MMKFLQKPHPFIFNLGSILVPALITFLVILVFAPFGLANIFSRVSYAVFFGVMVAFCIWIGVNGLQKLFSSHFEEENWTVGKEINLVFTILVFIVFVVFLIFAALRNFENVIDLFQIIFIRTLLISFFPILIMILYEQYHHQKQKWKEAQQLNHELQEKQIQLEQEKKQLQNEFQTKVEELENIAQPQKIVLEAENGKVALQLENEQIFYVQSEGNYVEVFYESQDKIQKELIRNSLKKLENELPQEQFFRCHKSYIVNLSKIQKVEGNARNLELILENIEAKIPVSRSKSQELSNLLKSKKE